jgi:hypothetical protein
MITVTPNGDYLVVNIRLKNGKIYGFESDDGTLSHAIDALVDNITKKELGFDKHDILMAISKKK